jgi:hypothetical protein
MRGRLPEGGLISFDSSIAVRTAVESMGVAVCRAHPIAPDIAAGRPVRLSNEAIRLPF